jgi:hypothetical protein
MVQLLFTLLPSILLALRVAAGPILVNENPITLDISRRFNFTGCSVVQSDLARINAFKNRSTVKNGLNARDVISEPVVNQAVNYIVRDFYPKITTALTGHSTQRPPLAWAAPRRPTTFSSTR